ncbi:hypothetical protein GCM10023088_79120 [Actinomadura verrucosospora]|uniref:toxin glutamine deamidase domain-containing protein n=1 Tax=Actinomadura verrucosospora TaxID=46165 RepID=UPI0031E58C03
MGLDHTGDGNDGRTGDVEKPSTKDGAWRPPPDRPGSPGQKSRIESRAAATSAERPVEERDGERVPADDEKPGAEAREKFGPGSEGEAGDRDARGTEAAADDQDGEEQSSVEAEAGGVGREPEQVRRDAAVGKDSDEGDEAVAEALAKEERPGSDRPAEQDAEEDGDGLAIGAESDLEPESDPEPESDSKPESEGESKDPAESDLWDEFASKAATYEVDGIKFGYRTWGEEFAARRASREDVQMNREADPVGMERLADRTFGAGETGDGERQGSVATGEDKPIGRLGPASGNDTANGADRQVALGERLAEEADKKVDAAINEALDKVNPKFDRAKSAYSENCTSVVQANELRRRGSEVEAGPLEKHLRKDENGPGGRPVGVIEQTWGGKFAPGTKAEIEDAFKDPGSRGIVYIQWNRGGGHVFSVENVGGKVRFVDGQPTPSVPDASHYFAVGRNTHYLRVDNRPQPSDAALKRFLEP